MDKSSDSFLKFYHSKVRVTSAYASRILLRKIDIAHNMTISACGMILLCSLFCFPSRDGNQRNVSINEFSFSTFTHLADTSIQKDLRNKNKPMLYNIPFN